MILDTIWRKKQSKSYLRECRKRHFYDKIQNDLLTVKYIIHIIIFDINTSKGWHLNYSYKFDLERPTNIDNKLNIHRRLNLICTSYIFFHLLFTYFQITSEKTIYFIGFLHSHYFNCLKNRWF